MRSKYILFALALTGALASCSDDDNKGTANYKNPYSNPLTDYSAADPTVWKENDHSFYVYATNTSVIRKSEDLIHWTPDIERWVINISCILPCLPWASLQLPVSVLLRLTLPKVLSHWIYR